MAKKEKVVKRDDGVNGLYSKETLDNGSTIELLSRRNPNESITYTERSITPQDTSYYIYNSTTPDMDRHVIGRKYVTPTKYNKMGWLGKRIIAGVRPDSWDSKFDSYQEPVDSFQPGGSIASRLWNKWTGKDTYTDGYGTTRSHTPVRESAHRTAIKAANSPLVQAIPVVGDIADGYVAADYAAKGDYKPAIAAIGAGLVLPNAMEVAGRMVPSSAYRNIADKADDFVEVLGVERPSKADDFVEVLGVEPPNKKWNRTPDKKFNNVEDNSSVWIPETQYDDDMNVIAGSLDDSMSSEPWWGWDPVEYQDGGEIPSNAAVSFLENLPYGRHNVDKHNKLVEMGKQFGNNIPGSVKPVPLPNKYQPAVPPVKMPTHEQDTSDIKPAPMPIYPGQSNDRMPMHRDNKFITPQKMYQEGGNLPSDNQQQQLFVAIITDMAKTLGVEPSQELAEAVMTAFENNDDSQGLLTLFTKTKNKFMNETGLFREGGKMIAFIEKFKCGGKSPKKKTSKKQEGGEVEGEGIGYLTTPVNDRQMRRNWREATGGTRREARQVQRNLTDHIESQGGISHGGARNAAAAMMGDPQRFAQPQESRVLGGVSTPTLNVSAPQLGTPASLEHNYDNFDFNTAFGRARGNGEDIFTWKGKEYTTELAPEKKSVVSNPDLLMGSPTTGGNYYDPNTNPMYQLGAKWGAKWRANRDARRAARNEREAALRTKVAEMNANYEPVSFTEAAMKVTPSRRS